MDERLKQEVLQVILSRQAELVAKLTHGSMITRPVKPLQDPTTLFRRFEVLNAHSNIQVTDILQVGSDKNTVQLAFIETTERVQTRHGISEHTDTICIAVFETSADWGRSLIRRESIIDKLAELFSPCEHDFDEYQEFSSKFCCFSNEVHKLRSGLTPAFTQLFLQTPLPVIVEFGFNTCMIKTDNTVMNPEPILEVLDFAMELRKLIK